MTEQKVGRLAFRVEGDKWACYYAMPDTMKDAIWMGAIMMNIVRAPERKQMFMQIMKDALSDFLDEKMGQRPDIYTEEPAPESERSGSA